VSTTTFCKTHGAVPASYSCASCRQPICDDCARTTDTGTIVCPSCEKPETLDTLDTVATTAEYDLRTPAPKADYRPTIHFGNPCKIHPEATAVASCNNCGAMVCSTCDFAFPGGIHLCPGCATNPKQGLSKRRKTMTMVSLGLGIFNLLASGGLFILSVAVARSNPEAANALGCFVILLLVSAAVGFALGLSAYNRRTENPFFIWIGPVLNGLIGLLWLGLIILGLASK
jgi:hypothetical protein